MKAVKINRRSARRRHGAARDRGRARRLPIRPERLQRRRDRRLHCSHRPLARDRARIWKLSFFPWLAVETGGVTVGNAAGFETAGGPDSASGNLPFATVPARGCPREDPAAAVPQGSRSAPSSSTACISTSRARLRAPRQLARPDGRANRARRSGATIGPVERPRRERRGVRNRRRARARRHGAMAREHERAPLLGDRSRSLDRGDRQQRSGHGGRHAEAR